MPQPLAAKLKLALFLRSSISDLWAAVMAAAFGTNWLAGVVLATFEAGGANAAGADFCAAGAGACAAGAGACAAGAGGTNAAGAGACAAGAGGTTAANGAG